ncbi:unnamed protein product [Pedinophyceae sp. YPF-701]|nr:unnamed protein product [Pedinophyceae sp. YPF-701]
MASQGQGDNLSSKLRGFLSRKKGDKAGKGGDEAGAKPLSGPNSGHAAPAGDARAPAAAAAAAPAPGKADCSVTGNLPKHGRFIATHDAMTTKTLQEALDKVHETDRKKGSTSATAEDGNAGGQKRRRLMQKRVAIVAEILASETVSEFKTVAKSPESQELIEKTVTNNLLFEMVSLPARKAIIDSMDYIELAAGQVIMKQGDSKADKFYVLEKGHAEIRKKAEDGSESGRIEIGPGSCFGEIALLYNTPRTATVTCKTACRLWVMERAVYKGIVTAYSRRITDEMFYLMESIPALSVLNEEQRRKLADAMDPMEFEDGETIFRKGDEADRFFLVKEGHIRIVDEGRTISMVSPGQGFGERALQFDIKRTADAVCEGYVVCYTITKQAFQRLIGPLHSMWRFDALRRVNILAAVTDQQVLRLAELMEERMYKSGDVVFEKGDEADAFYVVQDGEFRIYDEDTEYARVFQGSCFGELALLSDDLRTASVQAVTNGVLLCLKKQDFSDTLGQLEEIWLMWRMEALLRVPVLRVLSHEQLLRVAQNLEQELFNEGEVIVRAGDYGDKFYIVESGMVQVLAEDGREIRKLGGGSYFGEVALFYGTRRAATVKAMCYMSVLSLTADKVDDILEPVRRLMESNAKTYYFPKGFGFRPLKLGDLDMVKILGVGAFGVVHLVRHSGNYYALKAMSKGRLRQVGLTKHVRREKEVMLECTSPFVVNLIATFSDRMYIYMLMETVMGGELFTLLQSRTYPLSEQAAKFYAGCVILGLQHFAERHICFRDLKPENLLIAPNGYIKIADFGFAKKVWRGKTFTMCGTPDYMAPEMISHTGHTRAVDLWSLGVLIYEMVVGITPFYNPQNQIDTFRRIVQCNLQIPPHVGSKCKDVILKLMNLNPMKRLGMGTAGIDEIKQHPWFAGFNWEALSNQTLAAPFLPKIHDLEDTRNFDSIHPKDPRIQVTDVERNYQSEGEFADF